MKNLFFCVRKGRDRFSDLYLWKTIQKKGGKFWLDDFGFRKVFWRFYTYEE